MYMYMCMYMYVCMREMFVDRTLHVQMLLHSGEMTTEYIMTLTHSNNIHVRSSNIVACPLHSVYVYHSSHHCHGNRLRQLGVLGECACTCTCVCVKCLSLLPPILWFLSTHQLQRALTTHYG